VNPIQSVEIATEQQMQQFGEKLAPLLQIGDLIILDGPLGAGKTRLAQSIGKGLLVKSEITSPTFVIVKNYLGRIPFIHADAYRLLDSGIESFTDLDFESYLPSSVFVVEWGSGFVTTLTDQYLDIKISNGATETSREVEITPIGQRWSGFKV
jgi:tRNA threonylcarbamoyladenosine biosynthesis protein TsaE